MAVDIITETFVIYLMETGKYGRCVTIHLQLKFHAIM